MNSEVIGMSITAIGVIASHHIGILIIKDPSDLTRHHRWIHLRKALVLRTKTGVAISEGYEPCDP